MTKPIPFENPMLLVKQVSLNKVGLPLVKAEGGSVPIPIEMEARRVGEIVDILGPSLHFTWWPEFGEPPHPGDWLDLSVIKLRHDDIVSMNEAGEGAISPSHSIDDMLARARAAMVRAKGQVSPAAREVMLELGHSIDEIGDFLGFTDPEDRRATI